ncbi:MAG: transcription/translation regulatory transformer protein RfaH [Caldilineaceae bacterium]|nr:transcription/translation regulatory transformer protein RfaH [Caldilineaceae bacterium]
MAAGLLEQSLNVEVFLPEVFQQKQEQRKLMPLFPGYLFVRLDLAHPDSYRINQTPGVIRLVGFGRQALPVPEAVIDALRQRVEQVNAQGGIAAHSFKVGDRVRLTDGPLEGLEALFQGPLTPSQRVDVLLEFMGRLQTVKVEIDHLEAVRPHPPRRTRGKGRRIHCHQ